MKKLYPCFICEERYAEIEDAEVCERSHQREQDHEPPRPSIQDAVDAALAENPREKRP